MKKILLVGLLFSMVLLNAPVFAATHNAKAQKSATYTGTYGVNGEVTPKSIGSGALSLLVWPGIGQLMNDEKNMDKVVVHALLGFTGVFRFWSCYDGVVNRKGGVWKNRI